MRQYDQLLIDLMRKNEKHETSFGAGLTLKPVPDAAAPHMLDPRLVSVIERKLAHQKENDNAKPSLWATRNRTDKVSYWVNSLNSTRDERLIEVQADEKDRNHKIDLHIFVSDACRQGCPILVYLHGGGFTAGDISLFEKQMTLISELSGAVVVFPEYRLAPECPFPGAIWDAKATVLWAASHADEYGADGSRLMMAGDSAGGSLACSCVQLDADGVIKRLFLIYPAVDKGDYRSQHAYEWSWDAYEFAEEQRSLVEARIERIKGSVDREREGEESLYLQGRTDQTDPLVSAVYAKDDALGHFPRTVIATAEYDYLRIGAEFFAGRLTQLGVKTSLIRYEGCDHGFFDLLGVLPQAEELCMTIAEELRSM